MINEKHTVQLTEKERKTLLAVVSTGRNKAVVIQRAHILLKADEGRSDADISQLLYVSEQTIRRTRLRFVQVGLPTALADKPHPARPKKVNETQEAQLVALACSTPPAGQARWTVAQLTQAAVRQEIVPPLACETLRQVLKKTNSNRGK